MNEDTLSILGCGWLGKPLAEYFIKNGRKVNGSTTTPITKIKQEILQVSEGDKYNVLLNQVP